MSVKITPCREIPEMLRESFQNLWELVFSDTIPPEHNTPTSPLPLSWDTDKLLLPWNKPQWENDIAFYIMNEEMNKEVPVLAAARLRPILMTFRGRNYSLLGVADVASHPSVRGKGYGYRIVTEMQKYAEEQGLLAIGFCLHSNSNFYRKCGFKIIELALKKGDNWIYKNEDGTIKANQWDEDVLYSSTNASDGFINEILSHPEETVWLPRPHW